MSIDALTTQVFYLSIESKKKKKSCKMSDLTSTS